MVEHTRWPLRLHVVEYKGQSGKIISEGQHDIVIAFDYDADRKDRVTLPIDVNKAEVRNLMLEAER
jgi:hypothetical protein